MPTWSAFTGIFQKVYKVFFEILKTVPLAALTLFSIATFTFIYLEANRNVVIIEPFDIPDCIVQKGYSGKTVATNLIDKLNLLKIKTKKQSPDTQIFATKDLSKGPTIEVSGTGIPINYLVDPIRMITGKQKQSISGEIYLLDLEAGKIRLQLRITGKGSKAFDGALSEFSDIIFKAAKYISKDIQPFVLAKYYLWHDWAPNRDYLYRGMLENENIKNNKEQEARVFYFWGAHYLKQNCPEEAIEKYKKSLACKPNLLASIKGLGDAFQSAKKFKESIFYYKKIVTEFDRKYSPAYRRWGDALYTQKKYSEAIKKYKRAAYYNPKSIHAFANWGDALMAQSKYDEAMKKYLKAVDIDPKNHYSLLKMGNIFLFKKEYDAAKKKYKDAIEIKPKFTSAHIKLAELFKQIGENNSAIKSLEKARKLTQMDLEYAQKYYKPSNQSIAYLQSRLSMIMKNLGTFEKAQDLKE